MYKAQVDAFRANPWGLCSMHGNLWEWCRDRFYLYHLDGQWLERPGDGLKEIPPRVSPEFALRGGSFRTSARMARSAFRGRTRATNAEMDIGLRAVRPLRQPPR